jgi:hypothetical protein
MTYTLHPIDQGEGKLLWAKITLATWFGVLEPLLEPYPYIPVHPKVRVYVYSKLLAKVPYSYPRQGRITAANPEQTASILSWLSFSFMDPTIWRAYYVPHLSADQLPPLADYDEAEYLIEQHYQV